MVLGNANLDSNDCVQPTDYSEFGKFEKNMLRRGSTSDFTLDVKFYGIFLLPLG